MAVTQSEIGEAKPAAAGLFPSTLWSVVSGAVAAEPAHAEEALARLCELYREPILRWFRRAGLSAEDAQDESQAFLARHFAGQRLSHFERREARFRSWLLTCLRRQLADRIRRIRGEEVPLDSPDAPEFPASESSVALDLDRDVARAIHDRVLARLLSGWATSSPEVGRQLALLLFSDVQAGAYEALAPGLGMAPRELKRRVFEFRNDYAVAFHAEVRQIALPGDDEAEMRHLLALVPRSPDSPT
ncbi:MAG: sigma-70 family RNA polymerase sigma factor [Verrucomicrobiae bacterium]|nr:sigma-70 family RNA polymerase sigma factor [Verrucomicrobiae bacterium]